MLKVYVKLKLNVLIIKSIQKINRYKYKLEKEREKETDT
jgi:hypothetical protein